MTNIELFDLCDDLQIPRIPYSSCPNTWVRWKQEGKHTCIHGDGYVSVDYTDAREDYITVKDYQVVRIVGSIHDIDINLFLLISKISIPNYKLYFLEIWDGHEYTQIVSGITTDTSACEVSL